jgi:hypothetical protein
VPVDRRAGHAHRRADVVDADGARTAFGEQLRGGPQNLLAARRARHVGVQRGVLRGARPGSGHARMVAASVNAR